MPQCSVLIVDDDAGMVETLADILRAKTYQVDTAQSGEAAVSKARRRRFHRVLLDIRMPGMNGVETLRALKAIDPRTKVIMMTAYTGDGLVRQATQEGALAVLPKPVDIDRLLALLKRAASDQQQG